MMEMPVKASEISRRSMLGGSGAVAAGVLANQAGARTVPKREGSQPNLILFFPDEMRADALGSYGNPVCRTPNFDRLAAQGTRFEQCHVQYPVCVQSRCSMLTGLPTATSGHRSLQYLLQPGEPNLFRYLRQAGYDVFIFGKNHVLAEPTFSDSVTAWQQSPRRLSPGNLPDSLGPKGTTSMLWPAMGGDRRDTSDHDLIQYATSVLSRQQDRPFCIFLAMFQPHPPYTVPQDFWDMYRGEDLPPLVPPGLPGKPSYHASMRAAYGLDRLSDADLRKVRAVYYGQVSYSDWLLGELMQAMEKTGRDKDTALFVSSDHGDYAGDYGLVEKWPSGLEDCLTHVPLIGRIPGGKPGVVAPDMVELFDIMPTMLGLAGTEATHTHFARSLLPQLHGGAGDPKRSAFSEGGYNVYEKQAFEPVAKGLYGPKTSLEAISPADVSRSTSVRTPDHKLILRPQGQSELYDCKGDPQQRHNLIDDPALATVRGRLEQSLLYRYIHVSGVPPLHKDSNEVPPFYPTPEIRTGSIEALLDV